MKGYSSGVLMSLGFMVFFQDWMGVKAYTNYVQENWLFLPWQFSAAFIIVMIIIITKEVIACKKFEVIKNG